MTSSHKPAEPTKYALEFNTQALKEWGKLGNTLQRILGHGGIKMTMRYSHLAPDHFATVLNHSPLALLSEKDRQDAVNLHPL